MFYSLFFFFLSLSSPESNAAAWSAVITDMLRRLVVLLQHERRDIKFNVLRVLLNFANDRTDEVPSRS